MFGKPETTTLTDGPNAVCSVAVAADIWHRRLGHANPRSMDILRRESGNGVDYLGEPGPCNVCEVSKHKKNAHPKTTQRDLSRPGPLVYLDKMGPITSPAKSIGGSISYACKFTDGYTKMKDVFLPALKNVRDGRSSSRLQRARRGSERLPHRDLPMRQRWGIHRRRNAHLLQGRGNQAGIRSDEHSPKNRSIGERRTDTGRDRQMPPTRRGFPGQHVKRNDSNGSSSS